MRDGVSQIEEERVVLVYPHEIQRHHREHVMGVLALLAIKIALESKEEVVSVFWIWPAIESCGVIIVGVAVPQVPEPFVEPLSIGGAGSILHTQPPFADHAVGVAGPSQNFGYRSIARRQRQIRVAPDANVTGVQAGHERGAGGGADSAAGVALGEAQPFGGKPIDVRSLDFHLPVAAEIAVAEIIGEDKNDIRLVLSLEF